MEEFKGTKGERIHESDTHEFCDSGDYTTDEIVKVDGKCIAQYFSGGSISEEESEANAKLGGASLDLLEAVQNAMRIVDLWKAPDSLEEIKIGHVGELAALSMMRQGFEKAIEKALK